MSQIFGQTGSNHGSNQNSNHGSNRVEKLVEQDRIMNRFLGGTESKYWTKKVDS